MSINRKLRVNNRKFSNLCKFKDKVGNLNKSDGCDFREFLQKFKPDELEINCNNINKVKLGNKIGAGLFANMFEGE